ncbi:hypothetical protein G0U57_003598, partial [Chelydra serpentina]
MLHCLEMSKRTVMMMSKKFLTPMMMSTALGSVPRKSLE